MAAGIDQVTKILIFRNHDALFAHGKIDHVGIVQSPGNLADREHVVAILSQGVYYFEIAAFVGQKVQWRPAISGDYADLLVCQCISRVTHGGLNVLTR